MGSSSGKLEYLRGLSINVSKNAGDIKPYNLILEYTLKYAPISWRKIPFTEEDVRKDIHEHFLKNNVFYAYFESENNKDLQILKNFLKSLRKDYKVTRCMKKSNTHIFRIKKPNLFLKFLMQKERDLQKSTIFDRNIFGLIKSFIPKI